MTAHTSTRLASPGPQGFGPEVEFTWQEDRFVHSMWLADGENRTLVAEQIIESSELGIALVELHPQLDATPSPTLFLHGAGGGAQWSMSVEAPGNGTLRFDVAARVLRPPVERELVYRWHAVDAAFGRLEAYPTVWPRLFPGEGTSVEGPDAGGRMVLRITEPPGSCPCTLRWQYSLTLEGG